MSAAGDDVLLWASPLKGEGTIASGSVSSPVAAPAQGGKDVYLRAQGDDGTVLWEQQFGTEADDAALGNAVAPDGTVYAAGYTNGSLAADNQGSADIWVASFDADGAERWTQQLGGRLWDRAYGVVADDEGVYVTGYTFGEFAESGAGGADAFVARFDSEGSLSWLKQFGSDAVDWGQGATAGPDGSIFLVGFTEGSIAGANAGERDAFVMHVGSDGVLIDTQQFGTPLVDWATSAVFANDTLFVVGHTSGDLAGAAGGADVFVAAFDSTLEPTWSLQFGSAEADQGYGISAVADGLLVSGYTLGVLGDQSYGDRDGITARISFAGEIVELSQHGSSGADETYGVSMAGDLVRFVGYSTGPFGADSADGTDIIEIDFTN